MQIPETVENAAKVKARGTNGPDYVATLSCLLGELHMSGTKERFLKMGEPFNCLGGSYSAWNHVLRKCMTRSLSFESDRLSAISGIAQTFASSFKIKYHAGLWEKGPQF